MTAFDDPTPPTASGLPVLPVVTVDRLETVDGLLDALAGADVAAVEITLRTPGGLDALRRAAGGSLRVGAGTVVSADDVDAAVDAGADFLVGPAIEPDAVSRARARDRQLVPGVATPSEALTAQGLGCHLLKLFPASIAGGPAWLRAVAGPLPDLRFIPTGGIGPDTLADYLRLPNVAAVGGTWLAPRDDLAAGALDGIRGRLDELASRVAAAEREESE